MTATDAPEIQAGRKRAPRRFGLATRMALALLGAVLLLGMSALLTWYLLDELREDQARVAQNDLPRLMFAQQIAKNSAKIAASAPEFAAVPDDDGLARVRGMLDELSVPLTLDVEKMRRLDLKLAQADSNNDPIWSTLLSLFADDARHDAPRLYDLDRVDDLAAKMTATLDQLDIAASERIQLRAELQDLAFKAAHEGRRMDRRLAPLRDDLQFYLRTGWSSLDELGPTSETERLSPALTARGEAFSELAIASTEVKAALSEAAAAPSPDLISPLRERYEAALTSLREARSSITETEFPELLDRPIAGFVALGQGRRNVFEVRSRYFDLQSREQALLAESRSISAEIASAADALVIAAQGAMNDAAAHGEQIAAVGLRLLMALTAIAAIGAILIGRVYIGHNVVRRITVLAGAMRRMAGGDLETPAPITGADEITDMSEALEVFRRYARDAQRLNIVEQLADKLQAQNATLAETLAKLEQAEAETRVIARFPEENPNPMLRLSADRTVIYGNSAAFAIPGLTLPGMRVAGQVAEAAIQAFISAKPTRVTFETDNRAFDLTSAAVLGENYINIYGREVTEERRAQAQIIAQQKMASLGQLTAGIAHEIKNPLNFVNNFAKLSNELLEDLLAEVDRAKSVIEADVREEIEAIVEDLTTNLSRISEHGRRADSIVRGMLDHSRKESGDAQMIEINKLVNDFVDLAFHGLRGQDHSFNSAIEKHFDPAAGEIEVGAQDMSRVILNIANNAFQATHEHKQKVGDSYRPVLEVTTTSLGAAGVEIRLKDNGPGMPEHVRQRIFEPFFTTKPTGSGTGLGLSMSHDIIVQMHGGNLQVETAAGEGACFIITLPRRMPDDPERPRKAETNDD